MAQMNWSSYGKGDDRNQRPMMNIRQMEGERLHDQALSFFANGNFAQADLLLNKAIALEPSNVSFQETRNSFSQFPSTYSQQPKGVGRGLNEAESQRRPFGGNTIPATKSPKQTWDSRRLQGSSQFSNRKVFENKSSRSAWPQPTSGNAAQYFSNTVADNMFGPNYLVPSEGVPNLDPQKNCHFGDPRLSQRSNNPYAVRTNIGPQHGTACNTSNSSNEDHVWGEWNDPGAIKSNSTSKTSQMESGYQQSDKPWTDEHRKATSLPNYSRSSANYSVSQGSLRGSMANSAKDHHNKAGRSSEETCSETSYGLDNFEDVSHKVQEWLVKNESSGVVPPPDLAKLKKNKKKKKKTALPRKGTQESELQMEALLHDKREKAWAKQELSPLDGCNNPDKNTVIGRETSNQHAESKPSESWMNNDPYHNQTAHQRPVPSTDMPIINRNSDKLSQSNGNPKGLNSCKGSVKPFFDPKRIFNPSNPNKGSKPTRGMDQGDNNGSGRLNLEKNTEAESYSSNRKPFFKENRGQRNSEKTTGKNQMDLTNPRITSAGDQSHGRKSPQQTEIISPTKEMDRSRLDSSGSFESDMTGRMTKEEWEEIINRMCAPLGIPSNISQDYPEMDECISSEESDKNFRKQSSAFQHCGENSMKSSNLTTSKESCGSQLKTTNGGSTSNPDKMSSRAGSTNAAKEDSGNSSKKEYVDITAKLRASIRETCVPICHAGTSITTSAPAFNQTRMSLGRDQSLRTESTKKARPSCQTPLVKAATTQKESHSSDDGSNLPGIKPLPETKVKVSSAPIKSSKVTARGHGVASTDTNNFEETRSHTEKEPEASAKIPAASLKTFWEPSRIFGRPMKGQESKKTQESVSGSGAEANKKAAGNVSSTQQTTGIKKDTTKTACVDLPKGCDTNIKSDQESKKSSAENVEIHCTQPTATPERDFKSSSAKASNCLNNAGVSQAKAVPSNSSTKYSYVTWREQNTPEYKDSVKKSGSSCPKPAAGNVSFTSSESKSNIRYATEHLTGSQPVQNPAVKPTKVNKSQSNDKDPVTKSDPGLKIPSGNRSATGNTGTQQSQFQTSNKVPKSTSDTAATQAQSCSNSKNVPENHRMQSQEFSKTKDVPSNKMPQSKTNEDMRESNKSYSKESKTTSTSTTAPKSHPFQQKQEGPSTTNASQSGRPSTCSDSKCPSTSTSQGSRNQSSTSSGTRTQGSGESNDKDPVTKSDPGLKIPSGNRSATGNTGTQQSQFQTSNKVPKSTSDTAATQAQSCSNSKNVPENHRMQSQEFSKTKDVPSNKMPQSKTNEDMRESNRSYSKESKTTSTSTTAPKSHPFQQKQEGPSTTNASQSGRPSTCSDSKCPSTSTSQGSRNQSSTSSGTRMQGSGESASFRTREDDFGSRQRSRRQDATSEARAAPDELDIEDVDPWYKWTRAIGQGLWWALCFVVFLLLILLACLYSTLKVGATYSWHILQELLKLIQEHWQGERSHKGASGGQGSSNQGARGNRRAPVQPTRSIDIPTSGGAAIRRLLCCSQDDPYEVLGVSSDASEEDIKKYYRRQCMLVHPDKSDLPNAREAFQILQRAYETLTDPIKRREFEMESRHAHFDEEMEDFVNKMEEVLNTLSCDVCHGKHRRYETDRSPYNARYCRKHDTRHTASEGDMWVETTHLGFRWHYYAMMEDRIFNVTEWAACQDMRHMEANACEIRYRVGTKSNRSSSHQRNQPPNPHSFSNHHSQRGQDNNADNEELLKEFLRHFQQNESRAGGPGENYGGGGANNAYRERGRRPKKNRKKKR